MKKSIADSHHPASNPPPYYDGWMDKMRAAQKSIATQDRAAQCKNTPPSK